MHTQQEIYEQAIILPYEERKNLIKELEKSLRNGVDGSDISDEIELSIEEREKIIDRLRGVAAISGKKPPTDEEAKEEYYSYLAEKYK